jgi:metal-responsive CopG/Arc/MetJ family transcriptional regulator
MQKQRINIYITKKQKEQLEKMSAGENLPESEIIRRALDAYLAWYDPTYNPSSQAPNKERPFSPPG